MRITAWLNTLDPDGMAQLLRLRPDVARANPGSIRELAEQLSTAASVAAAVGRLDRDCRRVAQSVVILGGDGMTVDQLREFVRSDKQVLDAALERLAERGLVWPGARPGSLRMSVALFRHWPHPLGLSRPTEAVLQDMTKDPIREIAGRLGVPKGATRDDAIRNVCQGLSDAPKLRERAAAASTEARALLMELVWSSAGSVQPPRHVWRDYYSSRREPESDRLPAEQLYDLGLLICGSPHSPAILPRQAVLALRGPDAGPKLTGSPAGPPVPTPVEVGGAGPVVLDSLEVLRRLLDALTVGPLTLVKSGGLGQREVQRVARSCGLAPDNTKFWLEIAIRLGLLGPAEEGSYRPTTWVKFWQSQESADQWAQLASRWWRSTEPSGAQPPGISHLAAPVLHSLVTSGTAEVRRAVIEVLGALPPGHTTSELAAAVGWLVPGWSDAEARAEAVLAETEALGITVAGMLTPVGRAVASGSGDLRAEAAALLPAVTSTVALQSDLTAVAVGAVPAATANVLDAAADREGVGVWRFSRSSVRRALDNGRTGAELTTALTSFAAAELPQVLTQLIDDVARVHGNLRVVECGCCLVAADETLLTEVLGSRAALLPDLHRVAPTVAVGSGSATELVSALRELGYAPVIDPITGTTQLGHRQPPRTGRGTAASTGRGAAAATGKKKGAGTAGRARTSAVSVPPTQDPDQRGLAVFDPPGIPGPEQPDALTVAIRLCHQRPDLETRLDQAVAHFTSWGDGTPGTSQLSPEQLLLLARAHEEGLQVLVECSRLFTSRGGGHYLLDEVSLGHAQLAAWNPEWESGATFHLYELAAVELA